MEVIKDVWQRRMVDYYQDIERKLNAPKTGLLTTADDQARIQLQEAVDKLHQVARLVEVHVGRGLLSEDIRKSADRLNKLIKT